MLDKNSYDDIILKIMNPEPLKPPPQPPDVKKSSQGLWPFLGLVILGFAAAAGIFAFLTNPNLKNPLAPSAPRETTAKPPSIANTIVEVLPASPLKEEDNAAVQEKPLPVLTLSGILFGEKGSLALINGRIIAEGGLIEGAKLQKVSTDRVELSFGDKKIILRSR